MDFLDDRTRVIVLEWDKDDADAVKRAAMTFATYVNRGWIAFAAPADEQRIHVYTFDPAVEKIILAPVVEGG